MGIDDAFQVEVTPERAGILEQELALLRRFQTFWKAARLYPEDHPVWRQACSRFLEAMTGLQRSGSRDFILRIVGDEFYLEDILLVRESILYSSLLQELKTAGIGGVLISPSVTPYELALLVRVIKEGEISGAETDLEDLLHSKGVRAIRLEKLGEWEEDKGQGTSQTRLDQEYRGALAVMAEIVRQVERGQRIKLERARRVVSSLLERIKSHRTAMLGLTSLKGHDDYTCYHSINVLILSLSLGSLLCMDRPSLVALGMGALLHDLGKITIPKSILQKRGPLTESEWAVVKAHPVKGADILLAQPGIHPLSVAVAMEHHAHYDMSGYPRIKGKDRPALFSRIVEIADVYDAMTTTRPYQKARTPEQALRVLLKDSGTVFDPLLVSLFIKMMGIYPPGTLVRLSDGRVGLVGENTSDPCKPKVRVISVDDSLLERPYVLDLGNDKEEGGGVEITEVLNPVHEGLDLGSLLSGN